MAVTPTSPVRWDHTIFTMCKRTTTIYTHCGHMVKDHEKCDAARTFTSEASPPESIWCIKEAKFIITESCKACRQKSNATFKERARQHRSGERPYRRAAGCVIM